jgi:hypothetical protein
MSNLEYTGAYAMDHMLSLNGSKLQRNANKGSLLNDYRRVMKEEPKRYVWVVWDNGSMLFLHTNEENQLTKEMPKQVWALAKAFGKQVFRVFYYSRKTYIVEVQKPEDLRRYI